MTDLTLDTVPAYFVLGDAPNGQKNVELGLFFRVIDAEAHAKTIKGWHNVRVEPRQMAKADVHPAHHALFPAVFPQSTSPSTT